MSVLCLRFLLLFFAAESSVGFQGFSPFDMMRLQGIEVPGMTSEGEEIDTSSIATYDELYTDAVAAYDQQSWTETIRLMEKALADYEAVSEGLQTCKTQCNDSLDHVPAPLRDDVEYSYFHAILTRSQCVRRCKRNKFGNRAWSDVPKDVAQAFERRLPYMYLQLAYFKAGETIKAAQSAATYLYYNPDDELAVSNAKYYESLPDVTKDVFKPVDMMSHMELFDEAVALYDSGEKWAEAAVSFEKSLAEYVIEWKRCRLACEGRSVEPAGPHLDNLLGKQVAAMLECRRACANRLGSNRRGRVYDNFFAEIFHYLQFAYYKAGDSKLAVECAMTYLLYRPGEEVMLKNVELYRGLEGVKEEYFVPREDIVSKFNIEKTESELLRLTAEPDVEAQFRKNMAEDDPNLKIPVEPEIETPPTEEEKTVEEEIDKTEL